MNELIIWVFLSGIATFYLVEALLLRVRDSHEGPFSSHMFFTVAFKSLSHTQKFSLFDFIRLFFGVYERKNRVLFVREGSWIVDVWTCPRCLSMWMSLLFSVPLLVEFPLHLHEMVIIHFSISGISCFIHMFLDED